MFCSLSIFGIKRIKNFHSHRIHLFVVYFFFPFEGKINKKQNLKKDLMKKTALTWIQSADLLPR